MGEPTLDFLILIILKFIFMEVNYLSRKKVMDNVKTICESIAENLQYELVDVEFIKEHQDYFLRVYIHKPGGVNIDDCQKMSQLLSSKLDEDDPISVSYYLEVSSPGLDRPLKTDKDLNRNLGKEIELRLYEALDGKKGYEGILEGFTEEEIRIQTSTNDIINIPRQVVALIKLAVKF